MSQDSKRRSNNPSHAGLFHPKSISSRFFLDADQFTGRPCLFSITLANVGRKHVSASVSIERSPISAVRISIRLNGLRLLHSFVRRVVRQQRAQTVERRARSRAAQ